MKKVLLVGAVALFTAVNAQQTKFGLKAGYALSNLVSDELEQGLEDEWGVNGSNKAKSGFFVGGFVEHMLNDQVAIQGEVQYANLGGQIEGSFNEDDLRFTIVDKININQILIPISAKYYATPQFALFAGPSVAFNTSYKSDISIKDHNIPSEFMSDVNASLAIQEKEQDEALEENLKSTAFNIFAGAEYNVYKGLFLEARYTVGLTNYIKNTEENEELKMNFLQVGLGYKF